ncbi:hypothetical protein EJ08DRAFT_644362 [Tothia fuscella]|uniref:UBA domain-containing protein n=1 Tax=Tothia fuscella TaxID=1048955 RepID=A0A9P4P4I2_9PEZI|nr:hypothetical protein EJ08DRAFT_644362 [Tothia fuscella]
MDDLSGLDWSSSNQSPKPQTTNNKPLSFPSLQPTPPPTGAANSGRSTPSAFASLNIHSAASRSPHPPSKPTTPANDSFATLLSGNTKKIQNNLTLQERQRQLLEDKARQDEEQRKKLESHYGGQQGTFWDGLGQNGSETSSRAGTPAGVIGSRQITPGLSGAINRPFVGLNGSNGRIPSRGPGEEDDILAAFNSQAPVDASSHFPPQYFSGSGKGTPATMLDSNAPKATVSAAKKGDFNFDDDDDTFGLSNMLRKKSTPAPQIASGDDDDILGMLAKPVSELPRPEPPAKPRRSSPPSRPTENEDHPQSIAVAELVDMGFPVDKSADALAQTDTGTNVQAAVGILLNQAHEEAKQKVRGPQEQPQPSDLDSGRSRRPQREDGLGASTPSWMREAEERERSRTRNKEGIPPAGEKDVAKYAQDVGSSLFKSANSLWKTGQKKVQRAVADMQQEPDSSQPKWMRDAAMREAAGGSNGKAPQIDVTDEAMMLESDGGRPQKPNRQAQTRPSQSPFPEEKPRGVSPANTNPFQDRSSSQPKFMVQQQSSARPIGKLTRQEVENQAADVIVSSSRRRRPAAPTPTETLPVSQSPFDRPTRNTGSPFDRPSQNAQLPPIQSQNPFSIKPKPPQPAPTRKTQTTISTRPKAPPRQIPPTSASALSSSAKHRQTGTEAFKRGDYSAAHTHYSSALQALPQSHPVTIIIFCNRALTNLKVGDPKAAISDADTAISIIGVSRGDGEKITVGGNEGEKEMREFFGKAIMRKAEALEHMEKWSEAGVIWKQAVEAGVGGAVSIQGRTRCEKAAGGGGVSGQSTSTSRPAQPKKLPPRPKPASALSDLGGAPGSHQHAAVAKLREANAQAEKADDEKFALTDKVDAMLIEWKGTKSDNLRALLGSLDKILWPEAGWKKVGMADLVMPNKVKIVYMKAIAKVHPDKISQNASVEQRMVSASVFSTLNEAWDKFKADNGL